MQIATGEIEDDPRDPAKQFAREGGLKGGTARAKKLSPKKRANLTMRMHMRRYTRLTNAFSKKFENHCHMVALYAAWYNFVRVHKTLRVTPAMAAGVTDKLLDLTDIVRIVDEWEVNQATA